MKTLKELLQKREAVKAAMLKYLSRPEDDDGSDDEMRRHCDAHNRALVAIIKHRPANSAELVNKLRLMFAMMEVNDHEDRGHKHPKWEPLPYDVTLSLYRRTMSREIERIRQ